MIINIKTLATSITEAIGENVSTLNESPKLTIVMVGNNPASAVYVKNKLKKCQEVGIEGTLLHLEDTITEEALIAKIRELNASRVHGILVQSPLPKHINAQKIFDTIDPLKDVDGFSSANISRLYCGDDSGLVPATPKGVMKIIQSYFSGNLKNSNNAPLSRGDAGKAGGLGKRENLPIEVGFLPPLDRGANMEGKTVVVIGKSTIVGKPLSMLLLNAGATVTICHSRTRDIAEYTQNADIVISAVGKKNLITADMIRPGSLVIDVGINVEESEEGRILTGDCDTEEIAKIADITPVPGGVGPMTIAMLLVNVVTAYELQNSL